MENRNMNNGWFCEGEENGNMNKGWFSEGDPSFRTKAIHSGQNTDQWYSAIVIPPIHLGTTFKQEAPAKHKGYVYGRSGNPSRSVLETCIASIEESKYGLVFASGLAANNAVVNLLKAKDRILSSNDIYGGTSRFFNQLALNMDISTDFVDFVKPLSVSKSLTPDTKMIWIESPSNPLLNIMDIPTLVDAVKKYNQDIIVVVDNTFLTPYFQRPLELGADVVVYSLTKYMNGHSDVIMGAVTTNSESIQKKLVFIQEAAGLIPSPFDCFLVNRSLKTLALRMNTHMMNAYKVAAYLENHSKVERIIFPGLESHPQHKLAKKLWSGCSGMISVYIKGGLPESNKFLSSLKVFILAESLGGFESLAELPCLMTHSSVPENIRQQIGITDNLIRLSVGLEDSKDLISDLKQAFKQI